MAWQDYVNDKYSRKKEQQETAGSASPSPSSRQGSADALRTLEAQVNAQRKAAAGTWQGHINQKYGQQARAQAAQAQARRDQMASQLAGMAQSRQGTGTSAARYMRDNPVTAPDYERTSAIKPGAIINGMERPSGRQELPTQPIKTWQPGDRVFSAGTQQEPTTPDRRMYPGAVASDLVRPSGRQELPTQPIKTWQPGDSTFAEANPQEPGALAQLAEDAWANMQTAEERQARAQKLKEGLETAGNVANAFADNKALQGIGKLAGQGAQAAGQGLAMLWGELNKNAYETQSQAVERFEQANPNGLTANTQPILQQNLQGAIDALKSYEGATGWKSGKMDPLEKSALFDDRITMLQGMSTDDLSAYYEENGAMWDIGGTKLVSDKQENLEMAYIEARERRFEQEANKGEWESLKNLLPTSEEAMAAMLRAGGAFAQAVRDYREAMAARDSMVTRDADPGSLITIVNGMPMTPEQVQQYEWQIEENARVAQEKLRSGWAGYLDAQEEKRQYIKDAPELLEDSLRRAWNADIDEQTQTEHERLQAEVDRATHVYEDARRADYTKAYDEAVAAEDSANAYKRMYWASLPGYADFEEMSADGPYRRPTEEETAKYEVRGESLPPEMVNRVFMTDNQMATANYLYNTAGQKEAEEYLASIQGDINKRRMDYAEGKLYELGKDAPWLAAGVARLSAALNPVAGTLYSFGSLAGETARSLGANVAGSYLGMDVDRQARDFNFQLDPNHPLYGFDTARNALDAGVLKSMGNSTIGKLGQKIYSWTMSTLDSRLLDVVYGGAGEIYTALGAAASKTREVLKKTGDSGLAMVVGSAEGIIEAATEHIGSEKLADVIFGNSGKVLKDLIKASFAEGLEEGVGGILSETVDMLSMGDEAEFRQDLKNEGRGAAISNMFGRIAEQMAGGAWGGLILGGAGRTAQSFYTNAMNLISKHEINSAAKMYGKLADAFKANWNGETLPGMYQRQFQALYDAGANNIPMGMVQDFAGELLKGMDEETQQKIYMAGQNAVKEEAARDSELLAAQQAQDQQAVQQQAGEAATIPQAQQNMQTVQQEETARPVETRTEDVIRQAEQIASEPVARTVDGVRQTQAQVQAEERYQGQTEEQRVQSFFADQATPGVVRMYSKQKLNHQQGVQLMLLDRLAKHYGVEIDIVDSIAGGNASGMYQGGRRIQVALDATNQAYVQVAGHELVHYIKRNDAAAYNVLEQMITDTLAANGSNIEQMALKRMGDYAKYGQTLKADEAREEIVAEAIPAIFTDKAAVNELVNYNPTLAQKVRDFIVNFVDTLMDLAYTYADIEGHEEVKRMMIADAKDLMDIARSFDAALKGATEKAVANEQNQQAAGRVESTATEQAASVKTQTAEESDGLASTKEEAVANLKDEGFDVPKGESFAYMEDRASYRSLMNSDEVLRRDKAVADLVLGILGEPGWAKDEHTFTMPIESKGKTTTKTIKLTTAQLIEIYARSKRRADRKAMLSDGYTFTKGKSTYTLKIDEATLKDIVNTLTDEQKQMVKDAERYIDNMTSISAIIAQNRDKLDYEAEELYDALKSNSEYKWTVDFSTLCKKRALYTGTFNAIQEALPNTALTEDDFIAIRDMMAKEGYEVACAFCYVESRRKENGEIIQKFLDVYKEAQEKGVDMVLGAKGRKTSYATEPGFTPNIASFNTTDGIMDMIKNHKPVFDAYMKFMNARGTSKPKLIETITDYRNNDILTKFKLRRSVTSMNKRGGLRLQSFSDFIAPNLLDMMQVVTDMSKVGLMSQAYTKVPAFARIFGGTGIKINLSLVSKGLEADGNLIFDDVEGMPHEEAFEIRDMYSKNVGTILVAGNDEVLRAAMADPRIDFIIPYHRSGWTHANEVALGLGDYQDFTGEQNEIEISTGKKPKNAIYPKDYWLPELSGDENAKRYLKLCERRGLTPKFERFKDVPGYWKTLIDFKMYDNEGNYAPQQTVKPNINMEEATKVLMEYDGSQDIRALPIANDIVERFVSQKKAELTANGVTKFSMKATVERKGELVAVHNVSAEDLIKDIDMGGFPGISAAIVNAERGHEDFGSCSVVLYANAIDPTADEGNKVYGGDAWTPTFPDTVSVKNEDGIELLADRMERAKEELGNRGYGLKSLGLTDDKNETKELLYDMLDGELDTEEDSDYEGEGDTIEQLEKDYRVFITYLVETGQYDAIDKAIRLAKREGFPIWDTLESILRMYDMEQGKAYGEWWKEIKNNLTKLVFKKTGENVTAENAVNIMKGERERNNGAKGFRALYSAVAKRYKTMDEIREDSGRLSGNNLREYNKLQEKYNAIRHDIAEQWAKKEAKNDDEDEMEDLIKNAEKSYEKAIRKFYATDMSEQSLRRLFDKNGIPYSGDNIADILDLMKDASNLPADYFEAKLMRVTRFDQVAAVIVPTRGYVYANIAAEKAENAGMKVIRYNPFNPGSRLDALNSIDQPGVRFSLKNTGDKDVDAVRVLEGMNGRPTIRVYGINDNLKAQAGPAAVQQERYAAQLKAEQAAQKQARQAIDMTSREYAGMRKAAKTYGDKVLKENSSAYDKADMRENMGLLMDEIAKNGPSESTLNEAAKLGREILERDDSFKTEYADLRKRLRNTKIKLTDTQKQEAANIAGSYGAYMRSLFGTVFLSDEGMSLDGWWEELSQQYPELFPPDTSEGDMVQVLADVRERFKPGHNNPYGETLDAAATDLGLRMHEELLKILGDRKGAAGMREAVNELRAQYKAELTAELRRIQAERRAAFDKVAADLKAARAAGDRTAAAEAMKAYRSNLRRVGATQAEAMARIAYRQEYEDRTAMAKAYERIHKTAESLRRMLAKPDKQKHVPTALAPDIVNVLNMIDFTRNGRETEGVRQWNESLKRIGDFIARQMDIQNAILSNPNSGEDTNIWMDLCAPQVEQLKENIDLIIRNKTPIANMNMQEITAFSSALTQIQHCINSINQMWMNERHATVDEVGEATLQDMRERADNKAQNSQGIIRWLDSMINVQNLDAGSFFEKMGGRDGAAYSIYEELAKGQSESYARIREANEHMDEILGMTDENRRKRTKTIRGWANEEHTFELPLISKEGAQLHKVTMTGTQLMELYALSRRPQGRMHLLTGGMRISGKNGKQGNVRTWKMTEDQLDHMIGELNDDQKETVKRMQAYLSSEVSAWGNAVTQKMYLMTMFGEENYWPIQTVNDYRQTKEQDGTVLFNALTNAGFTKQLQDKVGNPLMIHDAMETFAGHISDMANFSGMAMPVDDLLRWFNYSARDEEGFVNYTESVKEELRRVFGADGKMYVQHLIDDLNGMSKQAPTTGWFKLVSNYKRAAIMAKLRVVIQQPTAILRAGAMIDPKYFTGALNGVGKHTVQEMQDHSALAWWKDKGNYEIGTGQSMKSVVLGMQDSGWDTFQDKLSEPAGRADNFGWAIIWQAVKRETAAEHKDLEVGSKAYWDHVVQRFEDICMSTQVVDTVLTRSEMMRSKDTGMKMATAFMSEPTRNVNMVRTAIAELVNAQRSGDKAAVRRAALKLTRSMTAIAAATALNAVVKAAFDTLKYRNPDEDKDEWGEEKSFWELMFGRIKENFWEDMNPLTNIPFIKDAFSLLQGETPERLDIVNLQRLINAGRTAIDYIYGNPKGYTWYGALTPLANALGGVLGMPVGLISDAEFAINMLKPGALRKKREDATASGAYEAMYKALAAGDKAHADRLRQDLNKDGKTDKTIDQGIADQLALRDDRIRQYWERRESGHSKGLLQLKKEIMADGWSEEIVIRAVNRYAAVIKNDAKAYYQKAMEKGDEERLEKYAEQLRAVGVTDDVMAKWAEESELENEQLEMKDEYTKKNLYTAVRNGDVTDAEIKDIVDSLQKYSDAEDPMSGIRSGLTTEFRQEYMDLIRSGKTSQAAKLRKRLEAAGAKPETIDKWEKDAKK